MLKKVKSTKPLQYGLVTAKQSFLVINIFVYMYLLHTNTYIIITYIYILVNGKNWEHFSSLNLEQERKKERFKKS